MSKEADFSQFEKYVKDFSKMINDLDSFLRNFLITEAERVIAKTKPRTPVDTGNLRNNWDVQGVEIQGNDLVAYLINDAEYATYVEYGHRSTGGNWVNGYFMLTISIDEVQKQMPKRFEKAFQEFIKSKGVG